MYTTLVLAMFLFGAFQVGQQSKPATESTLPDAPPALCYSQRSALFLLEGERFQINQKREPLKVQLDDLDGRLASVAETEKAIGAEYAQQHPGWHLDKKFRPVRNSTSLTGQRSESTPER